MFPYRRILPLFVIAGFGVAACSSGESALDVGGEDTTPEVAATTPDDGTGAETDADTTAMPTTTVASLADRGPVERL